MRHKWVSLFSPLIKKPPYGLDQEGLNGVMASDDCRFYFGIFYANTVIFFGVVTAKRKIKLAFVSLKGTVLFYLLGTNHNPTFF